MKDYKRVTKRKNDGQEDLSIYSGRKKVLKGEKVEIEKPCIFGSGNRLDWKPIPLTRPPQSWQYLY